MAPSNSAIIGIERAEPDRLFAMLDRLAILPGERQAVAEMTVGRGGVRIEVDRPPKCRDRLLGAPFHHRPIAERDLPPGIAVIESDRPFACSRPARRP